MPKVIVFGVLIVLVLAMVPPALIAQARAANSKNRRIHFVQDMDNQYKYRAQHANDLFNDNRAMRLPVEGTVARGELRLDDHFQRGVVENNWATTFPSQINVNRQFVEYGRERFNIYCQPCHGLAGYGDGIVNQRAMELMKTGPDIGHGTTWVQAKNLHEKAIREQPVGQIFNSLSNGVRTMAGYKSQLPTPDRWAIVAYIKALQRSQNALLEDVPTDERSRMERILMPNSKPGAKGGAS